MQKLLLIPALVLFRALSAEAQPDGDQPDYGTGRSAQQPDYFSLGVAAGAGTPEFIDSGFQLNPFPFIGFKWGSLYSDQAGLGYQLYADGKFRLSAIARFAVQDLNRNNVDALDDMESLNLPLYTGISADLPIGAYILTTSIQKEIGIASGGWRAIGQFGRTFPVNRQFLITPSVSVEWNDRTGTNYLYGVSFADALVTRPAYRAGSSFKTSGSFTGIYRISSKLTLIGSTGVTWHSDEIVNSPIVDKRTIFSTFLALGYNF